jgi:hypothetical protein
MTKNGFVSHIHRKKPKGRAMPETRRGPTMRNRKSARVSSMCLPSKRIGWGNQNYRDRRSNDQVRNGQSRLQHQTLYLPAQPRHRLTGSWYAKSDPFVAIPNSNQAKSTGDGKNVAAASAKVGTPDVLSANLRHAENNSLIEPSSFELNAGCHRNCCAI